MNVDEMFEDLHFYKIDEIECIAYIEIGKPSQFRKEIYFHYDKHTVQIYNSINMKQLQAINEKVKELRLE